MLVRESVLSFRIKNKIFLLGNLQKATVSAFADFPAFKAGTSTMRYRVCGMGSINNQNQRPRGLICVDMNPISFDECTTTTDGTTVNMPDDGTAICLQWLDRDNNVCMGDYGGDLFEFLK